MDKKVKAFFAAMGIATALLVPVSASADNSDSEVRLLREILDGKYFTLDEDNLQYILNLIRLNCFFLLEQILMI